MAERSFKQIPEAVIRDGVAAGKSDAQISRETGYERSAIGRRRRALGIASVPRPVNGRAFTDGQLAAWHAEGLTDSQIAEAAMVSTDTVATHRRTLGLPANIRRSEPFTDDQIRACHEDGLSDLAAAARLACAVTTYRRRRIALGLPALRARWSRGYPAAAAPLPLPDALRRAVRVAFALSPADPRILPLLEPHLAAEMAAA